MIAPGQGWAPEDGAFFGLGEPGYVSQVSLCPPLSRFEFQNIDKEAYGRVNFDEVTLGMTSCGAVGSGKGNDGMDTREDPAIPFPFEPYDVQKQLMKKIYSTLEKGGIGIFESPTGTVRREESMSLRAGADEGPRVFCG